MHGVGVAGVARYVLRGPIPPDGSPLEQERAITFASTGAELELDFAQPHRVAAILLVADHDDRYEVLASDDARPPRPIATIRPVSGGTGMRARALVLEAPVQARSLRLRPLGTGLSVLGALRVYEEVPPGWPHAVRETGRPGWPLLPGAGGLRFAVIRLGVALLGAAAFGVVLLLERTGAPRRRLRRAERVLALAGVLAGLCWWDFFQTASGTGFETTEHNYWDVYHYYLGAKYAPELGYTNLYQCTVTADDEDGFAVLYGARGVVRELRDNSAVPVAQVFASPERCLDRFSPERWAEFKHDVAFFRTHLPYALWNRLVIDHGYNASPVWTLFGGPIANLVPLSDAGFAVLMALDTCLLVALWGLAWVTFGTRAVSLALLLWGTSFATGNWWTHGAFLRHLWLFGSVAGLCCLRRGLPASAGALLAGATLLRIFPAFHVLGVALRALLDMLGARRISLDSTRRRFAVGGIAASVLLVAASLPVAGGPGVWRDFVANTRKHYEVRATNTMGMEALTEWRAVLGGSPSAQPPATRPDASALRRVRIATALLFLPLLLLALRRQPDWVAAILASAWLPFVTDLGSYYYAYLAVFAFLAGVRPGVGVAVALLAVALAALGVVYDGELVRGVFVWSSAAVVVFCVAVPLLFALRPGRTAVAAQNSPSTPSPLPDSRSAVSA